MRTYFDIYHCITNTDNENFIDSFHVPNKGNFKSSYVTIFWVLYFGDRFEND